MASLVSTLERFSRTRPDAPAYVDREVRMSYGELWSETGKCAAWLHSRGVRAGDSAALALDFGRHPIESLPLLCALGHLGAVVLPLHPDAPPANRVRLVERFRARWLVGTGPGVGGAAPLDPNDRNRQADGQLSNAPRGDDEHRPFLHMFTSGTTGDPKICLFTAGGLTAHRLQYSAELKSSPSDCQLGTLPWPGKSGLRFLLRMLAIGGAHLNEPFPETRETLAGLIRDFGLTQLVCTPWQLRRLLASDRVPLERLAGLRVLQVGGAFLSPDEIRAARDTITPNVYAVYAATEVGVIAHLAPRDPLAEPGVFGKLLPAVQGEAVDERDSPLPAERVGRLRFRTPSMPLGYEDNPRASAECFRDGWFYPGDQGSIDARGVLALRGRTDEEINFGGLKIAPADIEAVLAAHPDIADVAVVGIPDPLAGERPVAFAVFRRPVDAASLALFCRERLDRSHIPELFVPVERMPRNENGKIERAQLRRTYEALTALRRGGGATGRG